jgi:hypothetical protein
MQRSEAYSPSPTRIFHPVCGAQDIDFKADREPVVLPAAGVSASGNRRI